MVLAYDCDEFLEQSLEKTFDSGPVGNQVCLIQASSIDLQVQALAHDFRRQVHSPGISLMKLTASVAFL